MGICFSLEPALKRPPFIQFLRQTQILILEIFSYITVAKIFAFLELE